MGAREIPWDIPSPGTGRSQPQPYLQVEVVGPLPDDFVLRSGVPDLVLVDIVTPRSVSILIEGHRSPSNACK